MNSIKELLSYELKICLIHADRLKLALNKIEAMYPVNSTTVTNLREEELAYLDFFTTRLGKLQDNISKIFNLLLQYLGEPVDNCSFIDKLNKLEKLEILSDASWWQELRQLRNILTHEYPDDPNLIAENLNIAVIQAKRLLIFWESLNSYISTKI